MVGYAEALFLAFAVPAWLAASSRVAGGGQRAGRPGRPGPIPDGLFLIPALVVMALTGQPSRPMIAPLTTPRSPPFRPRPSGNDSRMARPPPRRWPVQPSTRSTCGQHRAPGWRGRTPERAGWDLHLVSPGSGAADDLVGCVPALVSAPARPLSSSSSSAAMAALVLAGRGLRCWRRWPEAVFCGSCGRRPRLCRPGTMSCPRTLLVIFPLWVALAGSRTGGPGSGMPT